MKSQKQNFEKRSNVWSVLLRFNVKAWAGERKLSIRRSPFYLIHECTQTHAHTHAHTSSFSGCQISQSNNSAISANFSSVLNVAPLVFMETFLAELSCMLGALLLPVPLFPILYYTVNISPRLSFIFQDSVLCCHLERHPFPIPFSQCFLRMKSSMVSNVQSTLLDV